jgi:hypothetical protein
MKVVFDLSAGRLAIEGDGPELIRVLEAARDLAPNIAQIQIVTSASDREHATHPQTQPPNNPQNGLDSGPAASPGTMRQFVRGLSLNNASERIAAVAYYVNRIEGKHSFSPKDMDGWFTMCGFQKPSQMPVALFDAKPKYGCVDSMGRAMWRISTQGENLIARKREGAGD